MGAVASRPEMGYSRGTPSSRSLALAEWAKQLHDQGHVTGWRNEKFSFWEDQVMDSVSTV
jgi:hypothetical protein